MEARVKSVLPLEVLQYFNGYFNTFFVVVMTAAFAYKGYEYPYPSGTIGWEIAFLFMFYLIDKSRLYLGSMGNKTEQGGPLIWAVLFSLPTIVLQVYYIRLQVYVTRLDQILCGIGLAFVAIEFLLYLYGIVLFQKSSSV